MVRASRPFSSAGPRSLQPRTLTGRVVWPVAWFDRSRSLAAFSDQSFRAGARGSRNGQRLHRVLSIDRGLLWGGQREGAGMATTPGSLHRGLRHGSLSR